MASPFRQMDDRREDTRIGVSWAVGVKSYVSGAAGGPDGDLRWRRYLPFTRSRVSAETSARLRKDTLFGVGVAAATGTLRRPWGRRIMDSGSVECQLVTLFTSADPTIFRGVGG